MDHDKIQPIYLQYQTAKLLTLESFFNFATERKKVKNKEFKFY